MLILRGACLLVATGLALLLAAPLEAQNPLPSQRHVVLGTVFDSIARAPLAGAVVQIESRDSANALFSATTDSTGHFRIANLPSGRFLIGFYHDALTALGLDAPLRSFELVADTIVTVDIGVPSAAVVHALRCGTDPEKRNSGMLVGFVRDAIGVAAMPGTVVAVEWRAIALDSGNPRTVTQRAVATVSSDGTYLACALPADAPLMLRASAPGHRIVSGPVTVPVSGVARQDVRLADSATSRGTAILRGSVVHESGKPVANGRVTIPVLARDAAVQNGTFVLTGLPLGTWTVEARAVGLEPRSVMVDATERGDAATTITLSDHTQQLDAVTVVGEPSRDRRVLEDVMLHRRQGFASVFLPGNPWLQGAQHVAEVLRAAKGFQYRSPTEVYGRPIPPQFYPAPAPRGRVLRNANWGCANIAVYLNGDRVIGGLEDLDHVVTVREVLAVEAYPDMTAIPPQWRTSDGTCAVVAVWTSRR